MHMADALISPTVGGTLWAVSASVTGWCCKRIHTERSDFRTPLMGVMAAFTFAAQMINFSIPGTGSSGHLGGGVLLAAVLGPEAALLTMVSVLTVQAVFFADGGLLALGCNIFNMGVIPCLIAYPLVFRKLVHSRLDRRRLAVASFAAAILALQLGAFSVVLQTVASGITELPFAGFALLMQPIHLAVGMVEGAATFAVVAFLSKTRPELIQAVEGPSASGSVKYAAVGFGVLALIAGGIVSRFAAEDPDGLEWAVGHLVGAETPTRYADEPTHEFSASVQSASALMPDYDFRQSPPAAQPIDLASTAGSPDASGTGTSAAGVAGGLIALLTAGLLAWILSRRKGLETRS